LINEGQTAYLQTTGEEVFVLAAYENKRLLPDNSTLSGWVCTVRRPVAGESGCYHVVETFTMEELETKEQRMQRHLEGQKMFEQRMQKAAQEAGFENVAGTPPTDEDLPN
jgi:hypothetical protein